MKGKILNGLFSVIYPIAIAVLIITLSIALPIYFRPFYYMQIEPLGLPEYTGREYSEIKAAYDEVLDYLVLPGREFGAGVFMYSEEGASHFADCKVLFNLNAAALIISLIVILVTLALSRIGKIELYTPCGLPLSAWAGIGTLSFFLLVGGIAALNFDKAFTVFHSIFFPGKDNWVFDPRKDEIIRAMPQEFFMNCAILIVSSIILLCLAITIVGFVRKRNRSKYK